MIPHSRLVWLNCYGIPLHLWNAVTFKKLGEKWGNVIQICKDTLHDISFAVGKVLISTQVMDIINQVVTVENRGAKFKVRVCEEQVVVNTTFRIDCNCKGCIAKDRLVEDDDMGNDVGSKEQVEENNMENERREEQVAENDVGMIIQVADNASIQMTHVEAIMEPTTKDSVK